LKPLIFYIVLFIFLSCSEKKNDMQTSTDNIYLDKAYEFLDEGHADSAFYAFNQAKDIFIEAKDSLNVANCLINMAITQKDQGDYFGAQETALQAIDFLDKSDPSHHIYLSTNYNNLGTATGKLNDFQQALTFYKLALQFSKDSLNNWIYQNNLAICYQNLKEYEKALEIYADLKDKTQTNAKQYARVLSNQARTKWLSDRNYPVVREFLKSLALRESENDLWGLNASYAHLTEYYMNVRSDSALWYATKMYNTATQMQSPDDQILALSKLIELSPEKDSKQYFHIYQSLSDSLHQARTAAKNQFALIRYEVEKNKADNLRLQKDNAVKANRLTQQYAITGGIGLLFILAVSGGSFYYKKRKQRLELEAQHKIKASKLKTSRKVHDVVANGIYRVMSEIENKEDIDREGILDKLEDVYHKSRDISYETEETFESDESYHERLTKLIKSFATDFREVFIVGNDSELWHTIDDDGREHIRQVLQELMVNMAKHSQADNVVFRFEKKGNSLTIYYSDDGIGLAKGISYGNGLKNTVSRIECLGGKITFVDELVKGLKVEITIPLH